MRHWPNLHAEMGELKAFKCKPGSESGPRSDGVDIGAVIRHVEPGVVVGVGCQFSSASCIGFRFLKVTDGKKSYPILNRS